MNQQSAASTDELFASVAADWLPIIARDAAERAEFAALVAGAEPCLPARAHILAWARWSLRHVRVVVLAQEPSCEPGVADGLAFSAQTAHAPTSLARIHECWRRQGLISERPASNTLVHLAAQGWALINIAPTVRAGAAGSQVALWAAWSRRTVCRLSEALPAGTRWLAWGSAALSLMSEVDHTRHLVWTWPHPIAAAHPSFTECTHFRDVAEAWPSLIWDPALTSTDFFTDCSARGNGQPGCRASYGVVCTRGLWLGREWGREVPAVVVAGVRAAPTNIRGEGWAIVRALTLAAALPRRELPQMRVRILTDSLFWITMIQRYIPAWIARGQSLDAKKNSDIVTELVRLGEGGLPASLVHVRAWHDRREPAPLTDDRYNWEGNRSAERAAERVLGLRSAQA